MLDNSSSEALVCSSEAACSLAPSARAWLLADISVALSWSNSTPCFRSLMTLRSGIVMKR